MTKVEFDCVVYQCDICKKIMSNRFLTEIDGKDYCRDCEKSYKAMQGQELKYDH